MQIRFQDTSFDVAIPDDATFRQALSVAAFDWPFATTTGGSASISEVRRRGDAYELLAPGREAVSVTAVQGACALLVDVVEAMMQERLNQLFLHGAGVVVGGRAIVMPSRAHAGKSTLTARLAAGGHTVLADDILPLTPDDRHGVALGIAPRLRLPLPPNVGDAFRTFIAANRAADDGRYLYLDAKCGRLAPRGTTAEIGAVLLLDRRPDGPAILQRATRSAALRALIRQNFSTGSTGSRLVDRLHAIVDRLPLFSLRYSDLNEAASLIERAFAAWPVETGHLPLAETEEEQAGASRPPDDVDPDLAFLRASGAKLREVDGDLFVCDAEEIAIYQLNTLGSGIWNLLAEPVSVREATDVVAGAFPDMARATVTDDVGRLFADLASAGLIAPQSSR